MSREESPLQKLNSGYSGTPDGWRKFLDCWWARDRGSMDPSVSIEFEKYRSATFRQAAHAQDETLKEIAAAETTLGARLPGSYRDFILATRGRYVLPYHISQFKSGGRDDFLPATKIGPVYRLEPELWQALVEDRQAPREIHYRYGYGESGRLLSDPARFDSKDAKELIGVGSAYVYGTFALNPRDKTTDGEWEAWNISPNLPGATRFRSFAEMMVHIYSEGSSGVRETRAASLAHDSCAKHLFKELPGAFAMEQR